jgi:UDPglucose 6-dehydrogenase
MAALDDADALLIVTEWKSFRSPDFAAIKHRLKLPLVFDGRNLYEPDAVRDAGLEYFSIGRRQTELQAAAPVPHPLAIVGSIAA